MKVIVGAGKTSYEGWLSTQESDLNLLKSSDWEKQFPLESIDAILAEHVWEHMTYEDGILAATNCYRFLKPGGYLRCAVPDKFFRKDWYQNTIKIGGPGPADHPAASHKFVYDYKSLSNIFKLAGFEVSLLEYCDEDGNFHFNYWNESDGRISRSYRYDTRNTPDELGWVSIIVDAKKPLIINIK